MKALRIIALAATLTASTSALAAEGSHSVSLDLDGDGRMDWAETAPGDDGEDLKIYLDAATQPEAGRKPDFVKKQVTTGTVSALEAAGSGSLVIRSAYNLYGNQWDETLTVVRRDGAFLVAGVERGWEWGVRRSNEQVDVSIGACDVNFLTGKALASRTVAPPKPVKARFRPVKLKDWSDKTEPKICRFGFR